MIIEDMEMVMYRQAFNNLTNLNEANVKSKIVVDELFKKRLGYSNCQFDYEPEVYRRDKIIDLIIEVTPKKKLYVETKRGDEDLKEKNIIQLANYMHIRSIEWGVLCNGKRLILMNNRIETTSNQMEALKDKVVFDINLFSSKDDRLLKFITKKFLFETQVTDYFRDISQFRALKFPLGQGSWNIYRNTLFNFFAYYAEKELKYRNLDEIRVDDLEAFFKYDQKLKENQKKSVNSSNTFKAKYSHLRSMFSELKKNNHHFHEEREKLILNLETVKVENSADTLNPENIAIILRFLKNGEHSTRDTVIFLLCIYLGLERSTIKALEWWMFQADFRQFHIEGKTIALPECLSVQLDLLYKENRMKGIKGTFLFYTWYRKKFNVFNDYSVNEVFDRFHKIDEKDLKWRYFSPQFIRINLIKKLFYHGFSIEEISYLTGADLLSLSKVIDNRDIFEKVTRIEQRQILKHPFHVQ